MTRLSLPTLTPMDIFVVGDVVIHEKAIIAPGTILQATMGNQILIEEGVCIGMGCVIAASQGNITLAQGAILGAGVLLAGAIAVGKHACIGAASTLWNVSVDPMAIVAPGSLLGDASRQVTIEKNVMASAVEDFPELAPSFDGDTDPWDTEEANPNGQDPPSSKSPVVGQVYINQLLYTLFPGRQPPSSSG
jgi:carbon dioxide concentrating mechanism protein CcmN